MGYFSNGSEGSDYEERFCSKCIHGQDENKPCAVWDAHLLHNYAECNKKDSILHMLIPQSKDGLRNDECAMFVRNPVVKDLI